MSSEPKAVVCRCGAPCREVVLERGGDHGWGDDKSRTILKYDEQALSALRAEVEVLRKVERRYAWLRKATPYRFKKIQDACTIDATDEIYFQSEKFDAGIDAAMENPA